MPVPLFGKADAAPAKSFAENARDHLPPRVNPMAMS